MDSTEHIHTDACNHGACEVNISEKERLASLAGGGLLTLLGLSRRSWGGLFIALIGAGFLFRGITQHCKLYDKLGINTAEEDYDAYYDGDDSD